LAEENLYQTRKEVNLMEYLIDPEEVTICGACPLYIKPCTTFCRIKPLYGVPPPIEA